MGMTMAVIQGTNSMANAWFKTKVPTFSILIAQKKFIELNVFYYKTLKQSLFALFGASVLLSMMFLFLYSQKLGIVHRFLPFAPVLLLMGTSFLQLLLDAMATYLRCHKKEPFLALSIAMGILTSITLYLVSKPYGVMGVTFSYFIILLMATIWGYKIFNLKKNEWHE
jgi:O-antigen/teichoic acid export membrane protein